MQHRFHSATGLAVLISMTIAAGSTLFDRSSDAAPAVVPAAGVPVATVPETTVPPTTEPATTTLATTAPATTVPATTAPPLVVPANPVVVFYGDSLGWEASEQLVAQFGVYPNVRVVTHTFGGTAICDWFQQMTDDATALRPWVAIVQFSGNALTPCMADATGDGYLARYRADAETAIAILRRSAERVFLVGAPIPRNAADNPDFKGGALNALYGELADAADVAYVDAGAAVLHDGAWTATLPCLPDEPCTGGVDAEGHGVNVVRAPDGGHFCPAGEAAKRGVTTACPVWSSGAYRFAAAIAAPVLALLGPGLLG
jgi:hypothetical protein